MKLIVRSRLLAGLLGLLMGGLAGHAMIFLLAANPHPI